MNAPACFLAGLLATASFAADPDRPDPRLTPGVINPAITDVCAIKWGRDVRHVSARMKKEVFARYGIAWERHAEFEVDHLISRELGGADDVRNLFPQHWAAPWGAHQKDRLENRLHALVCAQTITLREAQTAISADWIAAYKKYVQP